MRTFAISLIALVAIAFQAQAQGAGDVIRLSQYYFTGSARATAMGGAFGSLGADVSSMSLNPAGLGMYRSSEFVLTPGLSYLNSKSSIFGGSHTSDDKADLLFNNLSYVATTNFSSGPWESFSVGIGYNRLADFNRDVTMVSRQAPSSLLDEFVYYSNEGWGSPAYEDLAYNTYLLGYDTDPAGYFSDYTNEGYGQSMSRTLKTRGGIGEFVVSAGANLASTLYMGATLGIQDVSYKETMDHRENSKDLPFEYLDGFWFTDIFKMTGWGVNLKAGLVYRPVPSLRLGFAVHTPTWYDLDATQETYMDGYFRKDPALGGADVYANYSDNYIIDSYGFKIHSPFRYITSASYQFGDIGLISADYEFVNYNNSKINIGSDPIYSMDVNDAVQANYRNSGNLRIGGELRAGITAIRAGYAYYGSPDASSYFRDMKQQSFSGGLGWKFDVFYLDLAYVYFTQSENLRVYERSASEFVRASVKTNSSKIYATLGFKF